VSRQRRKTNGYAEIRTVVERMRGLADWMGKHRPDVTSLTLWRSDLELISRYPKMAAQFQISVPAEGPPKWRKFALMSATAASANSPG
jgi:hypothetical protein